VAAAATPAGSERGDVNTMAVLLNGKVALITGAGGGLGEGICTSLAAAGAAVACADIVTGRAEAIARKVTEAGGKALALHADVADRASVEGAGGRTGAALGGVLVNNAAIYPRRAWTEITEEEWERVIAVNLKGYFNCARACYPSMKERGGGHVVNVSSITFFVGFGMLLDYVSSKGAIVGFTRALAHEVGPEGITVNAIAPGAFPTDAEKIHPDPEGYNQWALDQQCIKRRGTPRDIGNLVVFLAGEASSFITGQTVVIDGGWAMH
jgi:NAD(P)-dependent dehydrogenase (short-subunit alcohol dehydrogenase family)